MITAKELNEIGKKYMKQHESISIKIVSMMLFPLVVIIFKGLIFDRIFQSSMLSNMIFFVFAGGIFILLLSLIGLKGRNLERDSGYRCPNCKKQIAHKATVVIASGNCPFCAVRVVEKIKAN